MTREELWSQTEKLAREIESMKFLIQNKPESSFSAQGILVSYESIDIEEFRSRIVEIYNEYSKLLNKWTEEEEKELID